ncbi:hypothetical protein QJS83_10765 [Bdellovibrio sp. 22V]|uniref:hypothetical protein n=1 Tax=Bdellovibrio sp. 22V TaxID=3044166 RepID=UPI002543852A|nr:hypothetical protein [Bdellovibrio sp. 22V]WII70942.1 hypothetical protein QJS83_10765 [Bdellovibrio sp. 22V]
MPDDMQLPTTLLILFLRKLGWNVTCDGEAMINKPRQILSFFVAGSGIFIFATVAIFFLWLYRGASMSWGEVKILCPIFLAVLVFGLIVSFLPLLRISDEYRFSRVKYRFYNLNDLSVGEISSKLRVLGYRQITDKLFIHEEFSDLSSYKDKKHPVRHFLEVHTVLGKGQNILVLKAWPLNKLATADWRLTIHDSLEELEQKVFHNMKRIYYKDVMAKAAHTKQSASGDMLSQ